MKLSRQRGIYGSPETWERIRRRARRLRMPISRLVVRCCLRAAGGEGPAEPPGHPLALGEDAQRRLLEDSRIAARSARIAVRAPGTRHTNAGKQTPTPGCGASAPSSEWRRASSTAHGTTSKARHEGSQDGSEGSCVAVETGVSGIR